MSDQETKPTEGANGTAEITSVTPTGKDEGIVDTNANNHEDKSNVQDATQDTSKPSDVEMIDVKNAIEQGEDKDDDEMEAEVARDILKGPQGMLRVSRGGCDSRQKSDASVLEKSSDPAQIRKQVEFYFSNSNLPNDNFLWEKTEGVKNKGVPLSLICSFARMRRFDPYSAVVDALKSSQNLIVEGTEGEETVRRKVAYDPTTDSTRATDERSTYIKGFGEETTNTQFEIEKFLAQYGKVQAVRLRRSDDKNKVFKGSVFVEWADKETADKFIALEPKPRWMDHPMQILPKITYMAAKSKDIRDGKVGMKGSNNFHRRPHGHGSGRGNRGSHRGSDANDWKKRRDEDQRNGFSDRRGSRGNRSRGRGGNRGRGRGRHQNGGDRATEEQQPAPRDDGKPRINMSKEGEKAVKQANGKRAREEDADIDANPAKKVDTKAAGSDTA
ncbi:hypothetical protein F5Y04DRAFT_262932 [Hypomontagnella monticulosa]|nr:hypothetical protein F5Y04DRAFT_262932 [Hypomontagnella monticulosa]